MSTSSTFISANTLKLTIPVGVGIISLAYLSAKFFGNRNIRTRYQDEQTIPKVAIRKGDSTHDIEYHENQDAFLLKCEQTYGPVFELQILNQTLTIVSGGTLAREVHVNDHFSFRDSVEHMTGYRAFVYSLIKSYTEGENILHETTVHYTMIRDGISTKLTSFTPDIVRKMSSLLDANIGPASSLEKGKLVEWPLLALQQVVSGTMVEVFMGPEIAKSTLVTDTFIACTTDFGLMLGQSNETRSTAKVLRIRAQHGVLNVMHKHLQVLVKAAEPVIEERHRQEQWAAENGVEYERPKDMMQMMLDRQEDFELVDLEDICGHLILLVLSSMHTTLEAGMNVLFYLAAYPDTIKPIYEEIMELLDQQTQDRQEQRKSYRESLASGGEEFSFVNTDLNPAGDRDITEHVIKKATKLDSFLKEMFRFRMERLSASHMAREDIMLSTGHVVRKGEKVLVNMRSVHQDKVHGDDLTEFRPWRFLGKNPGAAKASKDYMPFGIGKFTCPGRFLAVHDLKILAALLVTKYSDLVVEDKQKLPGMLASPLNFGSLTGMYFTSRYDINQTDTSPSTLVSTPKEE
ncbi:MAG: cytochrome P450 [Linnemannia gamsii]|nr:MAG: cytochrome P450 [Linnemannia gamsii]